MLDMQLHVSPLAELQPFLFTPVQNRPFFIKPLYGMWTSTLVDNSSAWVDWCRDEDFGNPDVLHWHVLTPDPAARIFELNTLDDLIALLARYPNPDREMAIYSRMFGYIDFDAMSRDYDALHMTERGQWATRYSEPSMNGWDCESTLWFRWCFTESFVLVPPAAPGKE